MAWPIAGLGQLLTNHFYRFGHSAEFGERLLIGCALGYRIAAVRQYPQTPQTCHSQAKKN
jgi:hypothetical protein